MEKRAPDFSESTQSKYVNFERLVRRSAGGSAARWRKDEGMGSKWLELKDIAGVERHGESAELSGGSC